MGGKRGMHVMGRWMRLALLPALLLLSGCGNGPEPDRGDRPERPLVSGVEVGEMRLVECDDMYQTSGTLIAKSTSMVAARTMGALTEVLVREGQSVTTGQLLALLDDRDLRQKVAGAEAALAEAEQGLASARRQRELADITFRRYERLFEGRALTGQERDQARIASEVAALEEARLAKVVERARAGRREAGVYREFSRITAPVSGIVIAKRAEVGSMAMPGAPLFTIEDNSSFALDLWVSETLAERINRESPVYIEMGSGMAGPTAAIAAIFPSVDPATRTFLVKVAVTGDNLRSGQHVTARIAVGRRAVLQLPTGAIVRKGQLTGAYAVDDKNVLSYRLVRTGRELGDMTEILTGLAPGEKVVVAGTERAVDGGVISGETGR